MTRVVVLEDELLLLGGLKATVEFLVRRIGVDLPAQTVHGVGCVFWPESSVRS